MVTAIAFGVAVEVSANPPLQRRHKAMAYLRRIAAVVVKDVAVRPIAVTAIADISRRP